MGHSDGLFPGPPMPVLSRPCRWALDPCSVAMTDLHSLQTMSAASWSFLSFAFITSNIIGCVLLQVGHQTRGNRARSSRADRGAQVLPPAGATVRPWPHASTMIQWRQPSARAWLRLDWFASADADCKNAYKT